MYREVDRSHVSKLLNIDPTETSLTPRIVLEKSCLQIQTGMFLANCKRDYVESEGLISVLDSSGLTHPKRRIRVCLRISEALGFEALDHPSHPRKHHHPNGPD